MTDTPTPQMTPEQRAELVKSTKMNAAMINFGEAIGNRATDCGTRHGAGRWDARGERCGLPIRARLLGRWKVPRSSALPRSSH